MTHGTMEDTLPEADERSGQGSGGRTGLKIAAAIVVVALGAGGAYAVLGGGSAPDTASTKTSTTKADKAAADKAAADKAAAAKASAKATADTDAATPAKAKPAKTAKPAALPSAKNMTISQKRTALIAYLKDGKFPLTEDSSPATAAKNACTLLEDGMKPDKLVTELSRGAGVSETLGRYFLVGATHFYCAKFSVQA